MPTRPKSLIVRATPKQEQRGTARERGYTTQWDKARKGFLARHPLCVACQSEGRVTAATDVDHIVPHRGDMELFWIRENWAALCARCHKVKTGRGE